MMKYVLPAIAGLMLSAGAASAFDSVSTDSGYITAVDVSRQLVTLNDGDSYIVPTGVANFKVGEQALVTYDDAKGGTPVATSFSASPYPTNDPNVDDTPDGPAS